MVVCRCPPASFNQNPFVALTFIAASAILTSATSVLAMNTVNRMLQARERMLQLLAEAEDASRIAARYSIWSGAPSVKGFSCSARGDESVLPSEVGGVRATNCFSSTADRSLGSSIFRFSRRRRHGSVCA